MTGDQFISAPSRRAGKCEVQHMISWTDYAVGNHRIECPSCGRGGRDKTAGLTIEDDGKGVVHCFRCSYVETWREQQTARRPGKAPTRPATPRKRASLAPHGLELWNACKSLRDTAGAEYLLARCCALPPEDGDLRFQPVLPHPSGYQGPALVALVTDAATGKPLTLHRTWIQADGNKADIQPARRLLGGHRKQGGVIRLWPDEAVTTGLAIAEGIETALTMAHDYKPVWSLIDAGNMEAFPVLAGIECLVIGADHDPAGLKAATACADRWAAAGVDVRIVTPDLPGTDWNDLVVVQA